MTTITISDPRGDLKKITDGAEHGTLATKLAGEELEGSAHNSRLRVTEDWKPHIFTGGTEETVYTGECRIGAIVNPTAGAVVVTIKDDTTTIINGLSIPANSAEGALKGIRIGTSLKVTAAADVTIGYREAELS